MNSLVKNTTLRFSRRGSDHAFYEPLDQSYATVGEDNYRKNLTSSRRKVTSVDHETKAFSYKRDRAKKRLIYLQSYNLGSGNTSSRKMLKSRRLKKAAVRVKSVAVSVVSFIRISSITVCKSRLAVNVFSPRPSQASYWVSSFLRSFKFRYTWTIAIPDGILFITSMYWIPRM